MEEFRPIEFQKTRDFDKKVNVTFEFLRQNFKPLGKSILVIAGPAVLVGSLFLGSFFSDFFSQALNTQRDPQESLRYFQSSSFWLGFALVYVFLFLSYVVTLATINSYVELYFRKKTNQIQTGEVWESVRSLIWRYLGSVLLILLCAAAASVALVVVGALLSQVSRFLTGLFFVAALIVFFYLVIGISFLFFIQAHEGLGFFEAAGRSLRLIQGKWWSTFGLLFVMSLIGGVISYVFIIPYYAYLFISTTHGIGSGGRPQLSESAKAVTLVFFTVYYMAQMLMQTLPQLGLVFQYFNLVERREARGLIGDIDQFGKSDPPGPQNDTLVSPPDAE